MGSFTGSSARKALVPSNSRPRFVHPLSSPEKENVSPPVPFTPVRPNRTRLPAGPGRPENDRAEVQESWCNVKPAAAGGNSKNPRLTIKKTVVKERGWSHDIGEIPELETREEVKAATLKTVFA